MMTVLIDHELYGVATTFENLDDAIATVRKCGDEFAEIEFFERGDGSICDEAGNVIGKMLDN